MPIEKVIAFDPGGTTGVAIARITEGVPAFRTFERVGLVPIYNLLYEERPDHIVFEKFFYQRRDKVDLTPVEVIGVIKLYAALSGTEYTGLSAQQAKRFWTDDKLKKLDLWKTSQRHGMDALRHLLYYLQFGLHLDLLKGLRPSDG